MKSGLGRVALGFVASGLIVTSAAGVASSWWSERQLLVVDPNAIIGDPVVFKASAAGGRRLFAENCASCHQRLGQGDLAFGVPALSDDVWVYGTGAPAEIERIVAYGVRSHHPKAWNLAAMPAFGTSTPSSSLPLKALSPGEIADVVEYLVSLRGEPASREAAVRGAAVYGGRGGCHDCHAADARGDSAIGAPSLVGPSWIYGDGSRTALSASITQGRQGVCPAWLDRLGPTAVRKLTIYVYSLSHPRIDGASR